MKNRVFWIAQSVVFGLILVACVTIAKENKRGDYWLSFETSQIVFDNDRNSLIPQTAIYDFVVDHFKEENGKEKKALTLYFDGCRADALINLEKLDSSAVLANGKEGGLYLSYTGGVEKSQETQHTSTSPGFATILTGEWAEGDGGHGVSNNGVAKNPGVKIYLNTIAELGFSGVFNYIWDPHVEIHKLDVAYTEENNLPVTYRRCKEMDEFSSDRDLEMAFAINEALTAGSSAEKDLVFGILENPDNMGHGFQFWNGTPEYVTSVVESDAHTATFIETIKNRPNYANEDWLILISTDHGGIDSWHGGQSDRERITWISSNKPFPAP